MEKRKAGGKGQLDERNKEPDQRDAERVRSQGTRLGSVESRSKQKGFAKLWRSSRAR